LDPLLITRAGADADRSELVNLLRDFGLDTRGCGLIRPIPPSGVFWLNPAPKGMGSASLPIRLTISSTSTSPG
ncbi:MAG: hypothetical protein ACREU7_15720, partial [Burkholderiales bacterium]